MAVETSPEDTGLDPIANINVTPFVDVVLVLLVIFMVTAPLVLKDSLNINLPRASSIDEKVTQTLGVVVTKEGQILLAGRPATQESLALKVQEALKKDPAANAVIAADTEARHGDVVKAIDWLKTAGLTHFAVQIERH